MSQCPNCNNYDLWPAVKLFSSALFPIACPACKQRLGVRGIFSGSYAASLEFVAIALFFLSNGSRPTIGGALLIALFCGVNLLLGLMQPLSRVGAGETVMARIFVGIGLSLVIATSVWKVLNG